MFNKDINTIYENYVAAQAPMTPAASNVRTLNMGYVTTPRAAEHAAYNLIEFIYNVCPNVQMREAVLRKMAQIYRRDNRKTS
jgi:hypothetical protein